MIDPTKKETPLVGIGEQESDESEADDESGEEEEDDAEEEMERSQVDAEEVNGDTDNESDIADEEEETVTDKLRARIHEALGDGAALTDTVSGLIVLSLHKLSVALFVRFFFARNRSTLTIYPTERCSLWTRH